MKKTIPKKRGEIPFMLVKIVLAIVGIAIAAGIILYIKGQADNLFSIFS